MSDFSINQAARMMRAGDEFSKTNRKLRNAMWDFADWLLGCVEASEIELMRAETGWGVRRLNYVQVELAFRENFANGSGWLTITTAAEMDQTAEIVKCCRYLARPEGERLFAWLEKQNQERKGLLEIVRAITTKATSEQPSLDEHDPSEGGGLFSSAKNEEGGGLFSRG